MKRATNKVVVVTGGNSGIGKGIAKKFFDEGARIVVFGRNQETLKAMQQELSDTILTVEGDVSKADDLKRLFEKTKKTFGKIDVLIANAGVAKKVAFDQISEDDFDSIVDINYRGLFFTVRYALEFLNDSASIILIGSVAAHSGINNHSIYSSSKAAVLQLAKNFALDLAPRKIRVNSISPGYVKTPIFDDRLLNDSAFLEKRLSYIPLQRIGIPEDIASAALFLSSKEASYITGTDLIVDGGFTALHAQPK